jgi:drug/metabolite transporter (DMT)-like permease
MRLPFLALTVAGVCWALGFPLGKLALGEMAAPHLVFLRFAVAAVVVAPFALWRPEARRLFRAPAVLLAGVLYGLAFIVQFEGLARTTVALSALLVGLMPALIAALAFLMREPVSRMSWAGVAAATLGALVIAGKPGASGTPLGLGLCLLALLLFLAWLVVVRRAPKEAPPLAVTAVSIVVAVFAIAPVAFVMHGPPNLALSPATWAGIVGQGVLATVIATAAWQWGSVRVSSASAGVFINIEPLLGAMLGVALFGDPLTAALSIGGLLIVGGSLVVVLGERGPRPRTSRTRRPRRPDATKPYGATVCRNLRARIPSPRLDLRRLRRHLARADLARC